MDGDDPASDLEALDFNDAEQSSAVRNLPMGSYGSTLLCKIFKMSPSQERKVLSHCQAVPADSDHLSGCCSRFRSV